MNFYTSIRLKFILYKNKSFIWDSKKNSFTALKNIESINIDLLTGIDRQKSTLLKNTINFSKGNLTNNALLWGARGNGKSTLIKSIFLYVSKDSKFLKLVQLNKTNIHDIEKIYNLISDFNNFRFVIFIDDLSFENINNDYKVIKSTLDGSILRQPNNVVLYVTSNRRHLMPRDMIDNERSSAIHTDESVEEKISLSDRFGLWIGFHNLSKQDYIRIVKKYFEYYNIKFSEKDIEESIKWSMQRGNRTGRTAWQFLIQYAAEKNLKINF